MKKNILYIVVLILACALTGAITYILMDKSDNANEKISENENENETKINFTEEELKEYLSYVPNINYLYGNEGFNVYNKPNNLLNMNDNIMINNALLKLQGNDLSDYMDFELPGTEYSFDYKISLKDVKELVYKMYSKDNLTLESYVLGDILKGTYSSGRVAFEYYNNYFYGWVACLECINSHVSYIEKYEFTNNELYIYEHAAYYNDNLGDNCQNPDTISDYIKNYEYTLTYTFDDDGWCKYDAQLENKSMLESLNENYFKTIKNNFTQYKHTFKKGNEGYYWYSTEVVNANTENNEAVNNSNNETNLDKAKKIAKELEKAVNDKNWNYLDQNADGSDAFKDYGIYNYVVDVDNYQYIKEYDEYVFNESYEWDKTKLESLKEVSLGKILIIKFDENGNVSIDTNCTGY